jgi:exopolysaccharide biosynthesis polyprenyl glycosylphosphotransferase
MRNNTSIIYNVCLLIGDGVALIGGLSVAYILRVSISHEVLSVPVSASTYLRFLLILTPVWLFTFAILGLYNERYYQKRLTEFARLLIGTFIGIMFAISYSYMINTPIFPARLVVIYGFVFSFVAVLFFRTIARGIQRDLFSYGVGLNNVLLVGDTKSNQSLVRSLPTKITGYRIVGIVGGKKYPIDELVKVKAYDNFNEAITGTAHKQIHTIIQTELYSSFKDNDEILTYAQSHHIAYRFVPGNSELFVGNIKVDLLQSMPIIAVNQTALIGWGQVVKRLTDILLGTILLIISSPFWLLIIIAQKISSPRGQIFYRVKRLSRFGQEVKIYKFRTMRQAYTNMSPEEGFKKMGRPELIEEYRRLGDQLPHDPRISRWSYFLRRSSLDELPQLFNVVRGDISLVGPRALDTFELEKYSKKNLILAVKSGLTGLAQISGLRDISFEERRRIDLYYVQNWSFWGDIVILIKTVWVVLFHKGAV